MNCPDCGEVMQLVHRQHNVGLYNIELGLYLERLKNSNSPALTQWVRKSLFVPRIDQYWFDTYHCKKCDWKWTKRT